MTKLTTSGMRCASVVASAERVLFGLAKAPSSTRWSSRTGSYQPPRKFADRLLAHQDIGREGSAALCRFDDTVDDQVRLPAIGGKRGVLRSLGHRLAIHKSGFIGRPTRPPGSGQAPGRPAVRSCRSGRAKLDRFVGEGPSAPGECRTTSPPVSRQAGLGHCDVNAAARHLFWTQQRCYERVTIDGEQGGENSQGVATYCSSVAAMAARCQPRWRVPVRSHRQPVPSQAGALSDARR